jgi:hypothetical protein
MKLGFIALTAALFFVAGHSANAEEQTFKKPKTGGYRLDWCYKFGAKCGDYAADKYCQTRGFDGQVDNEIDEDIGEFTETKVLGTGQICDEDICDGFKYITCERADDEDEPATQFFGKPSLNGVRLNICYTKNNQCSGKLAAKTYCNKQGFDNAISFGQSAPFTPLIPTRYIGNGKISTELFSIAIKNLTCSD